MMEVGVKVRVMRVLLSLMLLDVNVAQANFFSRLVKFGNDNDKKPAPSGATAVRGPEAQVGSIISFENGVPMVHLANNNKLPLVGFGVGNLQHDLIPPMVAEALQEDKKSRLIDTAHASDNEFLVSTGIIRGVNRLNLKEGEKVEVHVVTKVWYTHLGYERTKLSVQESLHELKPVLENDKVDLRLHILLHWPRCFDNIPWMNCERDEEDLPQYVKDTGPDPRQDPDAWKESWKALEDMYLSDDYPISSIGVSNFHLNDIEMMESFARIHPHILQVNVWALLYDSALIDYCHKHRVHVQVYNSMHGTMMQPADAPRAYHHIQKVAYELSKQTGREITPAQVLLAWLIQHGVSVIPRTSRMERLEENSALSVSQIPALTDHQVETIAHAVEAYLSGDDLEKDIHVSVSFHAVNNDIYVYWLDHTGDELRIAFVEKGDTFHESTYPNHKFRTYLASNRDVFADHEVTANFGDRADFHVEL